MAYPKANDYQLAIQNPEVTLSDIELKAAKVEMTPHGMPKARSGGFAVTYRLEAGTKQWAVRCFHRETPDLQQRYAEISSYLQSRKSNRFLRFEYQAQGILVNGTKYPIVKMDWQSDQTLESYVESNHHDPGKIRVLREQFEKTVTELEAIGCAHGDLQHGNILFGKQLTLIDYDGMYVPGMRATTSNEMGHVNYQSPQRAASDFGPYVDRFSAIAISLGLRAIELRPNLFEAYGRRDNILFVAKDFVNPGESQVFRELRTISELREWSDRFSALCQTAISTLPTLVDFNAGKVAIASSAPRGAVPTRAKLYQYPVVSALERDQLLVQAGDVVQIVGWVTDVALLSSQKGYRPYAFVNFSEWRQGGFRIVVWESILKEFEASSLPIQGLQGKWLTVTGLLQTYPMKNGTLVPQIIPDSMANFRVLRRGKTEAEEMLRDGARTVTVPAASSSPTRLSNAERLKHYRSRQTSVSVPPPVSSRTSNMTSAPARSNQHNKHIVSQYTARQPITPIVPSTPSYVWTPPPPAPPDPPGLPVAPTNSDKDEEFKSWVGCLGMMLIVILVIWFLNH